MTVQTHLRLRRRMVSFCLERALAACAGALVWLACFSPAACLAQNGIFADFSTSHGNFSCILDQTNAPQAVANFIGLATGQRAWVDPTTGRATTNRFFDDLTFHRVIPDFMIQGGSPNGLGTDGPGYAFRDETLPARPFNSFGLLAMANSGTNSNGAQFFVTVAPTPWLNNLHTIFGRVTSGSNVVYAISRVPTGANNKPLTNVVIQSIAIRRVGTAAQAFDIHAQDLPTVANVPVEIRRGTNSVALSYSNPLYTGNTIWYTDNLGGTWADSDFGIEISPPKVPLVEDAVAAPRRFYRVTQVQYAHSTLAPKDVYGRTNSLTFTTGGSGTMRVSFNNGGGGSYTFGTSSGTVTSYDWSQEPYRAMSWLGLSGLPVMQLKHDFVTGTSGRFSGTAYPNYPSGSGAFSVAGTFVLSGA